MKASICRHIAGLTAAILILSGCGGAQTQPPNAAFLPQGVVRKAKSTTSSGLIYATGACGGTCVLSYPSGSLVGELNVGDAGACADGSGNVFIADKSNLFEYAHGGTTPTHTFTVSDGEINGCSVDKKTGDIATAVVGTNSYNVVIFPNATGSPVTYTVNDFAIQYCGYDETGNLFVDGRHSGYPETFAFYELIKGGAQFTNISVSDGKSLNPGAVQWDGAYITVQSIGAKKGVTVYRLSLSGSNATIIGTTKLKNISRSAGQSWIQGDSIFVPYGSRANRLNRVKVGVWGYPAGGKVSQKFKQFDGPVNLQAVTFSSGS